MYVIDSVKPQPQRTRCYVKHNYLWRVFWFIFAACHYVIICIVHAFWSSATVIFAAPLKIIVARVGHAHNATNRPSRTKWAPNSLSCFSPRYRLSKPSEDWFCSAKLEQIRGWWRPTPQQPWFDRKWTKWRRCCQFWRTAMSCYALTNTRISNCKYLRRLYWTGLPEYHIGMRIAKLII